MADRSDNLRSDNLRDSAMMSHLLDALEEGADIGEYGRLTFVMVARHFLDDTEMVSLLQGQPGMETEEDARALVLQVRERGYNPPKRARILEWQEQQAFPICPAPDDPTACNVYAVLRFPDELYDNIDDYWEERAEASVDGG